MDSLNLDPRPLVRTGVTQLIDTEEVLANALMTALEETRVNVVGVANRTISVGDKTVQELQKEMRGIHSQFLFSARKVLASLELATVPSDGDTEEQTPPISPATEETPDPPTAAHTEQHNLIANLI